MAERLQLSSAARADQSVGALVEALARRLPSGRDARRDARDLLAALLDVPRHWPLLRENRWVESRVWRRACEAADAVTAGAPLAYAVGRATFRGLTLAVDERVLIPRPETELLVDLVLAHRGTGVGAGGGAGTGGRGSVGGGVAVDVGTGSGAIAIAIALEGKSAFERVIATDISTDALAVARANAEACGAAVEFRQGSLLSALNGAAPARPLACVVSNPPYISFDEIGQLPASVRNWEPAAALLSPGNGLSVTARLVRQAAARLADGGLLALEVDARRASLVAELVSTNERYHDVRVCLDLSGRERFVLATRRAGNGKGEQ